MNKPILMAAVVLVGLIGSAFAVPAFQIANAQGVPPPSSLEQQLKLAKEKVSSSPRANPAGANMTTGSNMTGAAGNTTGGTHDSSIHTTKPAGCGQFGNLPCGGGGGCGQFGNLPCR